MRLTKAGKELLPFLVIWRWAKFGEPWDLRGGPGETAKFLCELCEG